jgi:Domain of unknown function (DUF5615)
MVRLYANENFPLPAVEALRRFGHDVLTTAHSARAGQAIPDAEVLAFAITALLMRLGANHDSSPSGQWRSPTKVIALYYYGIPRDRDTIWRLQNTSRLVFSIEQCTECLGATTSLAYGDRVQLSWQA